ncbi:Gmad2 immunoglobulin-like domain-containing protein [Nocardioides caldifontis]|uniref:Gmad2 immunoglobulin-like domain-containing protein n=1 Tax=Nocardioides caldifontis TaxID=2588938 RepID=UPI0011DFEEDD|nr:Gmad2 immunoglobulin-like domain-containing protein [Nocardioides caldifontis]
MTDPYDGRTDHDALLRATLHDAVADVEPRPALDAVQARTKVTPMSSKRPWILAAAGAVVAVAATVGVVAAVTGDDPERTPVASQPTEEPSEEPDGGSEESPSDPTGSEEQQATVPVYYVGDQGAGPRLFREFRQVPKEDVAAAQVAEALRAAVGTEPLDPDYRTPWPAGTQIRGVTIDGTGQDDAVWIDLSGDDVERRPGGMSEEEATLALQQLVHTAQGVLQQRQPVGFLVDGEVGPTVLGLGTTGLVQAADPMEVQSSVWIINPQDGSEVATTFTVEGRGAFFEAAVNWELLKDGEVVDEGFTMSEEGMTLSPYSFEVTAEPGDYVLRVFEEDMSGGTEGFGSPEDTKRITVVE